MRNDIRQAFDEILEPPQPALEAMVRARLDAGPGRRQAALFQRFALVTIAAVALVLIGSLSINYLAATAPTCSGTYSVKGNVMTVSIVTDAAPASVSYSVTDQNGYSGFRPSAIVARGHSTYTESVSISPPVTLVDLSVEPSGRVTATFCKATLVP